MSFESPAAVRGWQWRHEWRWLLVLSFLLLLPAKNLWNFAVIAFAVTGVVMLAVPRLRPAARVSTVVGTALLAFASLWLPMLTSLPEAVNLEHSATTTAKYLRFAPAIIGIALLLADERSRVRLNWAIFVLLALWCADALWQVASGTNVFGYPLNPQRVQGMFHPRYRLGVMLAVLSPLWFEAVRQLALRHPQGWIRALVALAALPLPAVVLLSGTRSAWLMLAGSGLVYGAWLMTLAWRRGLGRSVVGGALVLVLAAGALASSSDGFRTRFAAASAVVSGDFATADAATSYRLSIWKPALAMWAAHPLTGIGPRGFRYAFAEHAEPDNFWRLRPEGRTTHPHNQWLEVAVETGAVGLAGLALFMVVFFRSLRGAFRRADGWAVAWCLCLCLAWWPTNVHSAVYAGFWASVMWWIAAIALASAGTRTCKAAPTPTMHDQRTTH